MRICHISDHPYDYDPERDGCRCGAQFDDYVMPKVPLVGTVPGGANDTADYRFHMDFDKGMDRYVAARRNGLAPAATTVAAVEQAEAQAASQQRALKKLGGAGEQLKVAPGVDNG
jgi:hypothetical protein